MEIIVQEKARDIILECNKLTKNLGNYSSYLFKAYDDLADDLDRLEDDFDKFLKMDYEEAKRFIAAEGAEFFHDLSTAFNLLTKHTDFFVNFVKHYEENLGKLQEADKHLSMMDHELADYSYYADLAKYEEITKDLLKESHEKLDYIIKYLNDIMLLRNKMIDEINNFRKDSRYFDELKKDYLDLMKKMEKDSNHIKKLDKEIIHNVNKIKHFFHKEAKIVPKK